MTEDWSYNAENLETIFKYSNLKQLLYIIFFSEAFAVFIKQYRLPDLT